MDWLFAVLAISLAILIHESGHYIAGKRKGIPLATFSLGFGPRLFGFTRGGTDHRVSLIPLGGYVMPKIKDVEEFHSIPVGRRIAFSLGGPMMNIILALVLLSMFNAVTYGPTPLNLFVLPFIQCGSFLISVLTAYATLFTNPGGLSGMVGMVSGGGAFISGSFVRFLSFMIAINLNLALFNLLPLPVLDGGKIFMALFEKISPGTRKAQVPATIVSLVLILLLMVFTTIVDIIKIFN
jgi:regulator of sigma E protease